MMTTEPTTNPSETTPAAPKTVFSTEFWQSSLVTVLGAVICIFGLIRSDSDLINLGLFVASGMAAVHTAGHSAVKIAGK